MIKARFYNDGVFVGNMKFEGNEPNQVMIKACAPKKWTTLEYADTVIKNSEVKREILSETKAEKPRKKKKDPKPVKEVEEMIEELSLDDDDEIADGVDLDFPEDNIQEE